MCVAGWGVLAVQRPAEKTPPAIISLVFAGLTLAPLALLVLALPTLGVNFKVRERCGDKMGSRRCLAVLGRYVPHSCWGGQLLQPCIASLTLGSRYSWASKGSMYKCWTEACAFLVAG